MKCVNGNVGYSIDKGHSYVPNNRCKNEATLGHILCESCRVDGGGIPKTIIIKSRPGD